MRLINADTLKAVFEEKSSVAVCGVELCKAIIRRIDEVPTVEAEPVRQGKWVGCTNAESVDYECKCSVCGYTLFNDFARNYKYCPNCGARMWKE